MGNNSSHTTTLEDTTMTTTTCDTTAKNFCGQLQVWMRRMHPMSSGSLILLKLEALSLQTNLLRSRWILSMQKTWCNLVGGHGPKLLLGPLSGKTVPVPS